MSKTYDIIEHLTMIHIEAKNDLAADGKFLESALMEAKIQGILHTGAYLLNEEERLAIWKKYGCAHSFVEVFF
ncbi:MAG: hypothetical protein M0R51_13885 [Clostridia bacterium]|jgi:hypothetical protein|nr:hypothetical protein [Clostridia bacterium]